MLIERGRMQAASAAMRVLLQRLQGRGAAGKPDEAPGVCHMPVCANTRLLRRNVLLQHLKTIQEDSICLQQLVTGRPRRLWHKAVSWRHWRESTFVLTLLCT